MKGFKFAGIHAKIRNKEKKDLGLIYCDKPAVASALFTKNKIVAAPVILGKEKIKTGLCQAVLVNSGNANCCTGEKGIKDCEFCSKFMADLLDIDESLVLCASTGVIGAYLPLEKIKQSMPKLISQLGDDCLHLEQFAQSILTTDTKTKIVQKNDKINGNEFSIMGIAKGSGMIHPDMATMLVFICTDIDIKANDLKQCLQISCEKSFNRISIDGDTSTNDMVLALASAKSKAKTSDDNTKQIFQNVLDNICFELSKMIVKDGEGVNKLVRILIKGARTSEDALNAARTIALSNLVKTAIHGEDPNWGRIIAAAGRSKAYLLPEKISLFFDDTPLVLKGEWLGFDAEKKAAQIMRKDEMKITLNFDVGDKTDFYLFCDFSEEYVKINADYRT